MSIVINGIKMPEAHDEMIELAIYGDGTVIQTGESWRSLEDGKCYYTPTTPETEKFGNVVSVLPHGDLIDRDKMKESIRMQTAFLRLMGGKFAEIAEELEKGFLQEIDNAPTVISAEEDEI